MNCESVQFVKERIQVRKFQIKLGKEKKMSVICVIADFKRKKSLLKWPPSPQLCLVPQQQKSFDSLRQIRKIAKKSAPFLFYSVHKVEKKVPVPYMLNL